MSDLDTAIEQQRRKNMEGRKESITESIEATTQEMVTIATLKEAIANWLKEAGYKKVNLKREKWL